MPMPRGLGAKAASETAAWEDAMSYPRIYNAATDMVDRNVTHGRGAKPAFIDPSETLTYGELQARCNRMANLLATYNLARKSRIALLLLDTVDFPVAFWGAIKAGVVPVCLNTLLTTEQYAYILGDSRAKALFVSAPLLPAVQPILGQLPYLKHIFVAGGEAPPFALSLRGELEFQSAEFQAADTCCDETAFWLYSSGSTGMPKGVRHVHSSPMETARLTGQQCLGVREDDLVFSAAKLFFAYGLGNAMSFPMSVGATAVLLPERPTPEVVFRTLKHYQPTLFFGVPTLYAGMLAYPQGTPDNGSQRLRLCVSAGEALPAEVGKAFSAKFGVDVLDGVGSTEMLHQYVCNSPTELKYGTSGKPIPGYEVRLVDEQGREVPDGEVGEMLVKGPQRGGGLLEPAREEPRHLRGRLDALGRQVHARCGGLLRLPGPHRRHVQGVGHLGVPVRGGERAHRPRRGAGGGRGAQGGRRRPPQAQGLHRAQARQVRRQRPGRRAQGARQGQGRPLEIPPLGRVRRRPAEDRDRQDSALQVARGMRLGQAWRSDRASIPQPGDLAGSKA